MSLLGEQRNGVASEVLVTPCGAVILSRNTRRATSAWTRHTGNMVSEVPVLQRFLRRARMPYPLSLGRLAREKCPWNMDFST